MDHRVSQRQTTKQQNRDHIPTTTTPPLPFAAGVGLLVGLALLFVALRLLTPFANDRLPPGAYVSAETGAPLAPLAAGPAGLQPGDAVIAIEGHALADWPHLPPLHDWQPDGPISFTVLRSGIPTEVDVTPGSYPLGAVLRREWGTMSYYLLFLLIAGYLFLRRPRLPAARVLLLGAAAQFGALPWSLGLHAGDLFSPLRFGLYHATTIISFTLAWIAYCHFALLFPRPLPLVRRPFFLPLLYGLPYLLLLVYLGGTFFQTGGGLDWVARWGPWTGVHAALFSLLTLVALGLQIRRSRGDTRQQIRWLVLAALLVAGAAILFYFLPPLLGLPALDSNLMGLIGALFPLAIAVSILRHRLFDIDTLLNRALVYGLLTACVAALYVAIVSLLGAILPGGDNLLVTLAATGAAAVIFQPLRDRLQRTVNRFMYGERDEPFEVLARLGARLESSLTPEMVYPTIVETVAQTLKLPYAAVAILRQGALETVETFGRTTAPPEAFPMTYQGESVGQLLVARRAPDEPFSDADRRILRNIARQAGAAVHAVQLLVDLQQSRRELVTAREEERRRLRRDLHDGLGPQLASQTLTIDAIERLLDRDPARARALLQDLKQQSRDAVADIRRLVYNLRPPALDELGLVGALEEVAARQAAHGPAIEVTADRLPPLPAAVEVAVYRIVQEALSNVVRHAVATRCAVVLEVEPAGLALTVTDNGRGLPPDYQSGVGLQSMRERASELGGSCRVNPAPGGGVVVATHLPLPHHSPQSSRKGHHE